MAVFLLSLRKSFDANITILCACENLECFVTFCQFFNLVDQLKLSPRTG